jgi:hypothetical protein
MAYNFNYETRFSAVNTMTPAINEAVQSVEMLRVKLDDTSTSALQASASFQGLNSAISSGGFSSSSYRDEVDRTTASLNSQYMATRGLIFGAQMSMFYVSMLTSNMMMMESATNNVEGAQERLNSVIASGGRGTLEYRNAVRQLENAQTNLNRAQMMTTIMTASIGLQTLSMGVTFLQFANRVDIAGAALSAYNAILTVTHMLTPTGWAILGGAAIVGGAYVASQAYQSSQSSSTSVSVNISDNELINEYNRRKGGTSAKVSGAG